MAFRSSFREKFPWDQILPSVSLPPLTLVSIHISSFSLSCDTTARDFSYPLSFSAKGQASKMRWSVWILTALLASLGQVMAANPDPTYLAARGLGDGPDDCDPGFFEMTEKNLRESKSDEFYRDLISKTSKEHPEEYIRLGEVSFFARHAFNGLEVRCGSHKKGCTGIPTCTDILDYVKRHGGDKEKARKVYFSIKKIEFIIDAIFWFHVSLL